MLAMAEHRRNKCKEFYLDLPSQIDPCVSSKVTYFKLGKPRNL